MDVSLKTMVLESVNITYIFALHNIFTGYIGSLTKDIMNNRVAQYERITASDIEMKKIPARILGDVTTNKYILQGLQLWSTM